MKKISYCILLLTVFSCDFKLSISHDPYFYTPEYRFDQIDESKVSLCRRYFVSNSRYNKITFDSISLSLICNAINNDSIPITDLYFTFDGGKSGDWYDPIVEYKWDIEKPNEIDRTLGNRSRWIPVPLDCPLNENYKID